VGRGRVEPQAPEGVLGACADRTIEASLDDGELKRAGWHLAQLEFYARIASSKKDFDVLDLYSDCTNYAKERMQQLKTARDIRAVLAKITA
jgi:hypothetical protein